MAGQHFRAANKFLKHSQFICSQSVTKEDEENDLVAKLTRQEETWNNNVKQLRARVEKIFANLKTNFRCLKRKYREGYDQLDNTIKIAVAVYNFRK